MSEFVSEWAGHTFSQPLEMVRRDSLKPGDVAVSSHFGPMGVKEIRLQGDKNQTSHIFWTPLNGQSRPNEIYPSHDRVPLVSRAPQATHEPGVKREPQFEERTISVQPSEYRVQRPIQVRVHENGNDYSSLLLTHTEAESLRDALTEYLSSKTERVYVVHTDYRPIGKPVIRHVYGPFTKPAAEAFARKVRADTRVDGELNVVATVHVLIGEEPN